MCVMDGLVATCFRHPEADRDAVSGVEPDRLAVARPAIDNRQAENVLVESGSGIEV
jgi:hypothetical protein